MTINVTAMQHQLEAQKRTINALQNENHWLQEVIFNPTYNEVDMRLLVETTPREIRMGLLSLADAPEQKIYYPVLAAAVNCSEKVASQHVRKFEKAGALAYRTEKDPESGNTRAYVQLLPPIETPSQVQIERAKRGGSTWKDGERVRRCNDCGSTQLSRVTQKFIMCDTCGTQQTAVLTICEPVNDPNCHIDTDPDPDPDPTPPNDPNCHIDTDPDGMSETNCHIDTDPEISKLPSISVYTVGIDGDPPEALKSLPLWCCHREKVPYNVTRMVREFQKAKSNDSRTWTTFEQAQAIYKESQSWKVPFDGIGVMNNGDYTFIDLDQCRDKETGELSEVAQEAIALIDSYTELSYSETGIHIIARGSVPKDFKKPFIEMYNGHRFFVWTGKHLANTPEQVEERQEKIEYVFKIMQRIIAPIVPEQQVEEREPVLHKSEHVQPGISSTCSSSDEEILHKGKDDSKFMDLYYGRNIGKYYLKKDGVTPDWSRADLALCKKISYWGGGGDVSTIDRIFRQSGLYREKWERDDYRMNTINLALGQHWQEAS